MKFTLNKIFTNLFLDARVTQVEFGYMTDTNKHSVREWVKCKNQMKFSTFESVCKSLGYTVEIKLIKRKTSNQS